MQQFIPFEDDWDALDNLRPEDLIPYRIDLLGKSAPAAQRAVPVLPPIFSSSPICAPMRCAVPADNSST